MAEETTNVLEQAEAALVTFKRSLREGHPWLPGATFISNPGLDLYVLAALEGWAHAQRSAGTNLVDNLS